MRSNDSVVWFLLSICLLWTSWASADSWDYKPEKTMRTEIFGGTRIVLTTDARNNRKFPEFILAIYGKNELLAQYRGVAFEKIFASPKNDLFLGLSNEGIPGTAVVVFDKKGTLIFVVNHGMAEFDYCEKSVTLIRKWFDAEKTDVKFIEDDKFGGFKSITLRDCKGNTVDLLQTILKAYDTSFQASASIDSH